MLSRRFPLVHGLLAALALSASGQPLDTLVFGDAASESSHALSAYFTITITNNSVSPAQPARRCTVVGPSNIYGGNLTFNLDVDPVRRTYFSARFWGGDEGTGPFGQASDMGRLYLYVPISQFTPGNTNNYQIGYRHEGDYICLNVAGSRGPLPGRFFYSTTLLPLWMTQGRTNLTFKIVSTGRIYPLGSSGTPATGDNYQFFMVTNSRAIYRAYTHTDPVLIPMDEVQGTAPATTTRPAPTESVLNPGGAFYNGVTSYISGRLSTAAANLSGSDIEFLARAYFVSNLTAYYGNAALVTTVVAGLDARATAHYADSTLAGSDWGGAFGELGWAIAVLSGVPQFQTNLDVTVNYGVGGNNTRREAWGEMLLASREFGRTHRDSRSLSNQGLISDEHIYKANRGLLALSNPNAFPEIDAQRYLLEAIGLRPWRGSDLPDGGSSWRFGTNYLQVTPKGLTREWGYVGISYGELQWYAANFYRYTTNAEFLDQCVKMLNARAPFRRPGVDASGANRYRSMEGIGLLAWRGAVESDGDFADEMAYGDRAAWSLPMRCAAVTLNSNAVGYAQQMLADNQYFYALTYDSRHYMDRGALNVWQDYATIKNLPANGIVLPMTSGQPDFVWADEVSGIVAIKRGEERLWIAPYWQAKTGTGVNGVARFHFSTTNYDQYGVLETMPQFDYSGAFYVRPNYMDKPEQNFYVPPDNPSNAYAGERLPVAAAPANAVDTAPFRGKCNFYAFRYGYYLVGMNATSDRTYELKLPAGLTAATNVATGSLTSAPVNVGPNSTVVLYVSSPTDDCAVPMPPLLLNANARNTPEVLLDWNPASGATGYLVQRGESSGGPYTTVAEVAGTNCTDASVTQGALYYYVVTATNACGESAYPSMEASLSAGLPPPWFDADVGGVGIPGAASYQSGVFTVRGSGSDLGSTSDQVHYAYLPLTNNGSITARIVSEQAAGSADKVGVMLRETTNANSKLAAVILDLASGEARFSNRSTTGGSMSWQQLSGVDQSLPLWVRVTRTGNAFAGYCSTDGATWTPIGTTNSISMASGIFAGLVVCSRNNSQLNTTTFDHVTSALWPALPTPPAQLTASAGDARVVLNWTASTNAVTYALKRATISGGPYAVIATNLANLSYTNSGLANGTTYYYVVAGVNVAGESVPSIEASAAPVSLVPPQIAAHWSAGIVQLTWPSGNRGWRLEMQTNALSTGLTTNWFTVPGTTDTNQVTLPVVFDSATTFFRLVYP